jgi:hypothetical protein
MSQVFHQAWSFRPCPAQKFCHVLADLIERNALKWVDPKPGYRRPNKQVGTTVAPPH